VKVYMIATFVLCLKNSPCIVIFNARIPPSGYANYVTWERNFQTRLNISKIYTFTVGFSKKYGYEGSVGVYATPTGPIPTP